MTNVKLIIRCAEYADISEIQALCKKVYPEFPPYKKAQLKGHINHFPEGQFVAIYEGKIIGYCATLCIAGDNALKSHTWREITSNGYGSTHNPEGDYLYGMEVFVDPDYRGLRIGQRLYTARKQLCQQLNLKGIVFGGRLPNMKKRLPKVDHDPEKYMEAIQDKSLRDPVFNFQRRMGFEFRGLMPDYLPSDKDSMGYATLMVWENTAHQPSSLEDTRNGKTYGFQKKGFVRLATVQYKQRSIQSFEEFEQIVTYFIDVVADYRSDFVCFPELFTLQLLSIENEPIPANKAIAKLSEYTPKIKALFQQLAIKYNVNIIAGSHPTKTTEGRIQNIAYVCLRDGAVYEQAKIHPTPNERYWWHIEGGQQLEVIPTDCGPIGVMICYDSEFPELGRHLVDQGANLLFVPFCTDERQSYLRVRYSCQARAVENQCYVVMSGNVGNLPRVHNMDIQYAQSCILTPCDFPFARDGIAADTTPNIETVAFADVHPDKLLEARSSGTVQNLKDRRHDLYSVTWHA
jgi:predicted amidohydrolase/GNAT superfamily N-acetyltransferase